MANTYLGADSAPQNPLAAFSHARAVYEMALADMRDAEPEMDDDCVLTLYCSAATDAADALLLVPAPDMDALAYKLEIFGSEEVYRREDEGVTEVLDALIADVRHLMGPV
jgi:hypothetical protein